MLWRLFVEDAESRVAFPGVAALYRALHAGAGGGEGNPMLYVSRAPWGLYEMLSEFFQRHGIPAGPVLFLREWGLSWTHPLPRRATDHKHALIRHMLALYRDLPFVLIGDSGQHDPEVYAQIVEENPGRVLAVYIRNVSRGSARVEEIVRLAGAVARAGSSLVLAADSVAMAEHAAAIGLIAPGAVTGVADEHAAAAETGPRRETARITPEPSGVADAAEDDRAGGDRRGPRRRRRRAGDPGGRAGDAGRAPAARCVNARPRSSPGRLSRAARSDRYRPSAAGTRRDGSRNGLPWEESRCA
ncbi:phosphatase domain-containing protein [Methylobacterium fujisawaense]|uniref:phosphatase domain-containing protein n=1 Tax=Methylobacterium fujisawaense TaxID=107400 RepID=UPI003AF6963A